MHLRFWATAAATLALAGCQTTITTAARKPEPAKPAAPAEKAKPLAAGLDPLARPDAFPSTYKPMPSRPTAIVGGNVFDGAGGYIENGLVLIRDGKVEGIGPAARQLAGYDVVDARGKWVTPGLIDAHSHLGAGASPGVAAHNDINELTNPVTAEVWVEHSVWPQDPGFNTARIGGVTTMLVLPGSGNLIGGRGVVLRNVPARTAQDMKFPGAPYALKMACGENPKRVYGQKQRAPSTRMGNVAGYRAAWINAADYARKWDEYRAKVAKNEKADPPKRDLALDTLAAVLRGEIQVENHCYRADEMVQMIDVAREFGYRIAAFHHAVEAYKIADILAANDICAATWANWWGFKMEALDGIEANVPLVDAVKGGCAIIKSDDPDLIQRLNQEAAAALAAGRAAGLTISEAQAMKWITLNPAKALGVAAQTGSLEPGKRADLVVWDRNPFSVYARTERVYLDGAIAYDRRDPRYQPKSDFELGQGDR